MFYHARCRQAVIAGDTMNYIAFGSGSKPLILLPGLGDGLSPVHGQVQAAALALTYRQFARDYTVCIFSRKNHLENGCSTRSMAKEQAEAMKAIGVLKAAVIGVSQGGMIAQYLAIDYPEMVDKLVLVVTLSKQNEMVKKVVRGWMEMAMQGDYSRLMVDTAENSYSEKYLSKYRSLYPLLGIIGKPKNFDRFLVQAASCIQHNSYSELDKIVCPTLIIGGGRDKIVGASSSPEIAGRIRNSEIYMYETLGHAAYEEATDFSNRVLQFLAR